VEKQLELEARLLGELSDSAKVAIGINVNCQPGLQVQIMEVLTDEEQNSHGHLSHCRG
jgi:hypothetical protein